MKMNKKRVIAAFSTMIALAGLSLAQAPASAQAVSYTSITELNQLIANLQQASQAAQLDLARLRIDKWKADSGTKHQTQGDTESVNRNLQNALPGMLADLKNSPENLALTFKVYRNLDALYDVFSSLVESTGAFGGKSWWMTPRLRPRSPQSTKSQFQNPRRPRPQRVLPPRLRASPPSILKNCAGPC